MQTSSIARTWTLAALVLAAPSILEAQEPPRIDLTGTVGWFINDRNEPDYGSTDVNHRWVFGADLGYYWTENLKSEIGVAGTTEASGFVLLPVSITPQRPYPYVSGRLRVQDVRVIAQQLYQFGHNTWVHPYIGAGVVVQRETTRTVFDPFYGSPGGLPPPRDVEDDTTRVRPVVSAGLKAYVAPRAFVRGDLRVSPWTESHDYSLSIGLGIDFK